MPPRLAGHKMFPRSAVVFLLALMSIPSPSLGFSVGSPDDGAHDSASRRNGRSVPSVGPNANTQVRQELRALQHPDSCDCDTRVITFNWNDEAGLAGNMHRLALALELALGSGRLVVITKNDPWRGYTVASGDSAVSHAGVCKGLSGFDCLFAPLSSCDASRVVISKGQCKSRFHEQSLDTERYGVLKALKPQLDGRRNAEQKTRILDFQYFGRNLQWYIYMSGARVSKYAHYGTFWLRSHVVSYLWRPRPRLMELARQHLGGFASRVYPPARLGVPNKERYVAVHVRQTDNLNAVTSEDLLFPHQYYVDPGTFLTLAAEVAKQHGVSVVYVETDNAALLKRLDKGFMALEGITWLYSKEAYRPSSGIFPSYIHNPTVEDSNGEIALRATIDMVAAMELFKHAEAVVGSMLSNVFRLGCELNVVGRRAHNMFNCHSIDVPWYTDP